jgi:ABC-type sugar transport system ATPase subunit
LRAIEFRSVCKECHGRRVIDTLPLKIEAKERVVLFGPSFPMREIQVNDDLVATAMKNLREPQQRRVGMVFQSRSGESPRDYSASRSASTMHLAQETTSAPW